MRKFLIFVGLVLPLFAAGCDQHKKPAVPKPAVALDCKDGVHSVSVADPATLGGYATRWEPCSSPDEPKNPADRVIP
jgi:hypothetical protein